MSFIIILFFCDCREGEWIKSANFIPSFAKEFVKSPETLRSQLTVNNILIDGSNLSQSNRPSPGEERMEDSPELGPLEITMRSLDEDLLLY